MAPTPLAASARLRTPLAILLQMLAATIALVAAAVGLLSGDLAVVLAGLATTVAVAGTSTAIDRGRWAQGRRGGVERACAAVLVAALLAAAAAVLAHAAVDWRDRAVFAIGGRWIAVQLVVAVAALSAAVLLLASLPLSASRRRAGTLLGAICAGGAAVALAAGGAAYADDGCDGYRPDRAQWLASLRPDDGSDAAARTAAKLLRCKTLIGLTHGEVVAMLGPGERNVSQPPATIGWSVGLANDYMGPGDGQYLTVTFVRGRAAQVGLTFPDQAVR